jgi:hypothetical protein
MSSVSAVTSGRTFGAELIPVGLDMVGSTARRRVEPRRLEYGLYLPRTASCRRLAQAGRRTWSSCKRARVCRGLPSVRGSPAAQRGPHKAAAAPAGGAADIIASTRARTASRQSGPYAPVWISSRSTASARSRRTVRPAGDGGLHYRGDQTDRRVALGLRSRQLNRHRPPIPRPTTGARLIPRV